MAFPLDQINIGVAPDDGTGDDLRTAFAKANALIAAAALGGVVDAGSNSNGSWIRFASGVQICWANKTGLTGVAINTANSGWGYRSSEQSAAFPKGFNSAVRTFATVGANSVGFLVMAGGSSATDFTWNLVSGASIDNTGTYSVAVLAIGPWDSNDP